MILHLLQDLYLGLPHLLGAIMVFLKKTSQVHIDVLMPDAQIDELY